MSLPLGHLKKATLTLGKNELQVSFKDRVILVIEWRVLGYKNILWKALSLRVHRVGGKGARSVNICPF